MVLAPTVVWGARVGPKRKKVTKEAYAKTPCAPATPEIDSLRTQTRSLSWRVVPSAGDWGARGCSNNRKRSERDAYMHLRTHLYTLNHRQGLSGYVRDPRRRPRAPAPALSRHQRGKVRIKGASKPVDRRSWRALKHEALWVPGCRTGWINRAMYTMGCRWS
jgi:hypothetical protein